MPRGKSKTEADPPPKSRGGRVIYEEGSFTWLRVVRKGDAYAGIWEKATVKATYEGDPEGPRGFGSTRPEAESMLGRYATPKEER